MAEGYERRVGARHGLEDSGKPSRQPALGKQEGVVARRSAEVVESETIGAFPFNLGSPMRTHTSLLSTVALLLVVGCGAPRPSGPESILTEDIHQHLSVIAADSMMGRYTPSPELDLTAAYVADQFKRVGLKPGGENGTWFQRYPLTSSTLNPETSAVTMVIGDSSVRIGLTGDAFNRFGIPGEPVSGPLLLVGGQVTASTVATIDAAGRIVLLVVDSTAPATQLAFRLLGRGANGILIATALSEEELERGHQRQVRPQVAVDNGGPQRSVSPILTINERAVADLLRAVRVDLSVTRSATRPVLRDLKQVTTTIALEKTVGESLTAPNTIGILEGSDPVLKNEYLVYSAHMDHIGIRSGQADSISNGADDDASGTVGVIELAEAFGRLPEPPKRSIIFLTVSGEERGLWGSAWFADHPTVPLDQIVANINIDMIGRNWPDSIVAIGKEHSDLGTTLANVNAAHPDLGMTAIDDRWPEQNFYGRSDHFNFARKGIPILFFFNGVHEDYHQVTDEVDRIDTEKMTRIIRLLYYFGEEIANAPARPVWNPESYQRIVEGNGSR